jgi:biopolymer transport protein ExbD
MRSRQPRIVAAAPTDPLFSALNTTPLIDVMLVLLIMFIVTIPIATHSVKLDLPGGVTPPTQEPQIHRLGLDGSGRLSWDGAPMAEAALPARLAAFRDARDDAILEFQAEGETRYETFDRVLATVKRSGIARLGFVGNERFAAAAG